jgi:hypothetical protein
VAQKNIEDLFELKKNTFSFTGHKGPELFAIPELPSTYSVRQQHIQECVTTLFLKNGMQPS